MEKEENQNSTSVDQNQEAVKEKEKPAENLAEEKIEEKYIPPKTKKNLSPAVRKIVKENN